MSPETDYTRQRTVAELLAEHGDAGDPGRRRHRRGGQGGQGAEQPMRPPPPGPGAPPPHGHRYAPPPDGRGRPAPPREPGPQALPPRGPGARPPAPGLPPGGRRDRQPDVRPDVIDDRRPRPGHPGPSGFRDNPSRPMPARGVPGGDRPDAGRPTPDQAPRPNGSGPLRAVPPANGSGPVRAVPPTNGSGPVRAVAPSNGSGPLRAVPPGAPAGREAQRGGPVPGPGPLRGASRLDAVHGGPAPGCAPAAPHGPSLRNAGPWPSRDDDPGRRGRPAPDPGPATGAYEPFTFDDEDDEVGPATVVGRAGADPRARAATAPPRRDAVPPASPHRNGSGPATWFDGTGRPAPSPGVRPGGPSARVDADRRGDGPATQFDVARVRRDDGPATEVGTDLPDGGPATVAGGRTGATRRATPRDDGGPATVAGPRTGDGPPTEVGTTRSGGRRRAPGRPGFGLGLLGGRPGRAGAVPAEARGAAPPVARRTVDDPTELTGLDGRTEIAAPRRTAFAPPPTRDEPDLFESRDYADADDVDPPAGLDERDLPDVLDDLDEVRHDAADAYADLDDRDLDEQDLDGRQTGRDIGRETDREIDGDLDERDLDDEDLDDRDVRPAHAWAGVVAQWLAGAVAGAVLWVLFRYLWRGLPVVALAAALLVTAGLVLLVRQFLHDVDRRTTMFAVLVGLLLTASPAVLVLLGR